NEYRALRNLATGSPFLMTWLIAAAGGFVFFWAIVTWRRRDQWLARPLLMIFGIILVLIGIAPIWWPWVNPHPMEIDSDVLGALPVWKRSIFQFRMAEPVQAPALLIYWGSLALLVVSLVWLTLKSVMAFRKTAFPLLAAIISCLVAV